MPETHDSQPFHFVRGPLIVSLESCFWHLQKYPRRRIAPNTPPITETAAPRELEDPYRRGVGRVFRIPLTRRALVVGYWVPAEHDVLPEEEHGKLLEAIEGAHIPGITATEIAAWARPRAYNLLQLLLRWLGIEKWAPRAEEAPRRARETKDSGEHVVTEWDPNMPVLDLEEARAAKRPLDPHKVDPRWHLDGA